MARYPTFTRSAQIGANIVTPPNIDQAGLREQVRGARSLSENAERVQNFAFKEAEKRAKVRGARAGSEDPSGTLARFGGERPEYGFEAQAAFDAAVGLASVEIETQARLAMRETLFKYQKNKGDPQDLSQELDDIREGFASSVDDLDPLSAAKIRSKLSSAGQGLFLDYSADFLKEQQRQLEATGITLFSTAENEASIVGRQTGTDDSLAALIANYADSAQALGINPKVIATDIEKLKDNFHVARVRGLFASTPDKQNFIDQFEKDLDKGTGLARGLSEGSKFTLGRQIQSELNVELADQRRQANDARVATNKKIAAADKENNEVNKQVNAGLNVSETKIAQIKENANQTGDLGLIAKAEGLESRFKLKEYYKSKSPEQIRQAALKYKELLQDRDITEQDRLTFQMLESLAKNTEVSVKSNLAEHYEKVGEPLTPLDLNNPESLIDRQQKIDAFAIKMGFAEPASYFTESELTALKSSYDDPGTTNGQKIAVFEKIFEGFGDKSPAVLNQIAKNNPAAAQIGAMVYVGGDRDFAHTIMTGQAILNTPGRLKGTEAKIDQDTKTVFSIQLRSVLGTSYEDDFGPILSSVHAAYMGLAAENTPVNLGDSDEVLKLISRVMGSTEIDGVQHGGVTKYNGKLLMIPNSISTDDDAPNSLVGLFKGNNTQPMSQGGGRYIYNIPNKDKDPSAIGITSDELKSLGYEVYNKRAKKPVLIDQEFRDLITLQNFGENKVILTMGDSGQMFEDKSGDPIVIDLNDLIGLRINVEDLLGEGF